MGDYRNNYDESTWMDIGIFMEQAHNLSTLIIQGIGNTYIDLLITKDIYLYLPRHIKHLEIPINDLNQIKMILDRCKNLATIKFYYRDTILPERVTSWFADNTIYTTCEENSETTSVWLGKKKLEALCSV